MPEPETLVVVADNDAPSSEASVVVRAYGDFLKDFDSFISALHKQYESHVNCRAGCSKCCVEGVQVTAVEASEIELAVHELEDRVRDVVRQNVAAAGTGRCPALHLDVCTIYDRRPMFCRMFGLPLVDDDPPLTLCDLNFNSFFGDDHDKPLPTISLAVVRSKLRVFNEALSGGEPPPTRSVRAVLSETLARMEQGGGPVGPKLSGEGSGPPQSLPDETST